jgi:hypothetical protein
MKSSHCRGLTILELLFVLGLTACSLGLGYWAWDSWASRHALDVHMRQLTVLLATRDLLQRYGYETWLCHGHHYTCIQDPNAPYLIGVRRPTEKMKWRQFAALGKVGTIWKFFGQQIWNAPITGMNQIQRTQNGSILFCQKGRVQSALVLNTQGVIHQLNPLDPQITPDLAAHYAKLSSFCY